MIPAEILVNAYCQGFFPMGLPDGEIGWFAPERRGILPLDRFHVPHGLARVLQKNQFEIRIDASFGEVIRACARREDTWINPEILRSYENLYRLGLAHSVETWFEGELAGGLYGVAIGGAFFGESMFHSKRDASKVALHGLVQHLIKRGFSLLDTQWITPHLQQFGGIEIPRREYLKLLKRGLEKNVCFHAEPA